MTLVIPFKNSKYIYLCLCVQYGVFPLKGKMLNVREAAAKQITENQEIQNVIKTMGLQIGKQYENVKQLRYGSIMIMADQDSKKNLKLTQPDIVIF